MSRSKAATQAKGLKALVLWSREKKTGLESISNVPPNARFEGAVSPVMFQGDRKYYPAKVIMISAATAKRETILFVPFRDLKFVFPNDHVERVFQQILKQKLKNKRNSTFAYNDAAALEQKSKEIERHIEESKQDSGLMNNTQRSKRAPKKLSKAGAATVRAIDVATGMRPSVPKDLEAAHKENQLEKKYAKQSLYQAQLLVDHQVMTGPRKSLFRPENDAPGTNYNELEWDDDNNVLDDSEDENCEATSQDIQNSQSKSDGKWCGCKSCQFLQEYDSPLFHNFFQELSCIFSANVDEDPEEIKFLELLPLPPNVKPVELSPSSNVFIAASDKDELKVDFRNKPASLAKETLYRLYGKEAFQTLPVTGMGTKKGTWTIPENVKRAVVSFINRYVESDKRISLKNFVALINKRAPEWRRTQSPKQRKEKAQQRLKSL